MKRITFFKTLLLAAGLMVGASAWAGETTEKLTSMASAYVDLANPNVNYNGASTELTSLHTKSSQYRTGDAKNAPIRVATNVFPQIAFYKFSLSSLIGHEGTIKTAMFDVDLVGSGDGKYISNILFLGYPGNWDPTTITWNNISNNAGTVTGTVSGGSSFQPLGSTDTWTSGTDFPINYAKDVKTYLESAIDANADYVTFAVIHNSSRVANWSKSAGLTVVYSTAVATTYTVKFQDGSGNTLKDDVTYDTFEGENYTASSADMATFKSADYSKVYTYASGNENKTAEATAANNVITLVFDVTDNSILTATVNAIDASSNVLGIFSATGYDGTSGYVYTTRAVEKDGKYYTVAAANGNSAANYGKYMAFGASMNVTYTADESIYYYAEVENLRKSSNDALNYEGNVPERASGGHWYRLTGKRHVYTQTLEPGVYSIDISARNQGSSNYTLYVKTRDSSGTLTDSGSATWASSNNSVQTVSSIIVPSGSSIALYGGDGNSNVAIDYIILRKITIPAKIGDTGYTTFASSYALDLANLPNGLQAFYAYGNEQDVVKFRTVEKAAVAGTGLLLKGTAGETYSIPVAASGETVSGNLLVGCTTETVLGANANYYVMVNNNDIAVFQCLDQKGATIPAGKAYLNVAAGAGARLSFSFDDDTTTGISSMHNSEFIMHNEVYNLNGQRIVKPSKGLYIVNGKKYFNK